MCLSYFEMKIPKFNFNFILFQQEEMFSICALCMLGVLLFGSAKILSSRKRANIRTNSVKRRKEKLLSNLKAFEQQFGKFTESQKTILNLDYTELRGKLQNGELSAVKVLKAYQAKAVEVNKLTNAVTEFLEDATKTAKELDTLSKEDRKPLHGIPISLKV